MVVHPRNGRPKNARREEIHRENRSRDRNQARLGYGRERAEGEDDRQDRAHGREGAGPGHHRRGVVVPCPEATERRAAAGHSNRESGGRFHREVRRGPKPWRSGRSSRRRLLSATPPGSALAPLTEIGRASCREREKIWVVGR